jgi:hypothetical protein
VIRARAVDLVHVNTITPMDPPCRAPIPSIVHARELVDQDDCSHAA